MVTARAFVALLAGFAVITAIVLGVTAVLRGIAPDWVEPQPKLQPGYVFVNLGYPFLAAVAGGYVTAWAAALNPFPDILGLAIIVLILGAIGVLQARISHRQEEARGRQPAWYVLMVVVIPPLGVLAGGLLRLRVLGIL